MVIDVLEGYVNFPKESFEKHLETFYPLSVGLLEKDIGTDMRHALWSMFRRVGELRFGMPEYVQPRGREGSVSSTRNGSTSALPTSPGHSSRGFEYGVGSRRGSRHSRTGGQ